MIAAVPLYHSKSGSKIFPKNKIILLLTKIFNLDLNILNSEIQNLLIVILASAFQKISIAKKSVSEVDSFYFESNRSKTKQKINYLQFNKNIIYTVKNLYRTNFIRKQLYKSTIVS
jgi:hypothetical protein